MFKIKIGQLKTMLFTVTVVCVLFLCTCLQSVYAQDRVLEINQINYRGHTALMRAVNIGDFDTVLKLLELGADPYIKNDRGESAIDLHLKDIEEYGESSMDAQKRYIWYAFLAMTEKKADRQAKWVVKRIQTSNKLDEVGLTQARNKVATLMETREKVLSPNAPMSETTSP